MSWRGPKPFWNEGPVEEDFLPAPRWPLRFPQASGSGGDQIRWTLPMPQAEGRRRLLLLAVAVASIYACFRIFRTSHSHVSWEAPYQGDRKYQRRIVAIGDLHGDLPNTLKVMKMTGVINNNNDWNPKGVDFLVQTGDIVGK
jgi:hypothetical protein